MLPPNAVCKTDGVVVVVVVVVVVLPVVVELTGVLVNLRHAAKMVSTATASTTTNRGLIGFIISGLMLTV